jgi:hypothetical protein
MFAVALSVVVLSQVPPGPGIDPQACSARLFPTQAETPPSAAWTWAGAVGGGIAGALMGLNAAIQIANTLPSGTRATLSPSLYAGSIAVGLATAAVGGYLLGNAAREGHLPGKIGVWSIWAALGTVLTGFVVVSLMVSQIHATPLAQPGATH